MKTTYIFTGTDVPKILALQEQEPQLRENYMNYDYTCRSGLGYSPCGEQLMTCYREGYVYYSRCSCSNIYPEKNWREYLQVEHDDALVQNQEQF
jgi:hypothetical protein